MHCGNPLPPLRGSKQEGTLSGGYALTVFTPGYYLNAPTALLPACIRLLWLCRFIG